ncbi:helix-turn-helix domain-containing protein [Legionella clemsonensis]|uniref:HTH-type transcriptional activator RhaR n=1 Tax=Legionella clemsonensis TaxID=1867846 RepID=A0A222P1E0_9GAMM|nr:AraC family transcriptional regulator [Legionella clemsonensis]ASQ45631.1 HTH-type transcriptional activator RhaR [Legionella clemsonensis]
MSVLFSLRSYTTETCSHSHDFTQLVLPLKGQLELEIGGQAGVVKEMTAANIRSDIRHCFAGSDNNLFLVVDLPYNSSEWLTHKLPSFLNLNPALKKYLEFVHCYLETQSDPLANYHLYQLLVSLLLTDLKTFDRTVIQAKDWIAQHLATPVDIARLAKHCHLSKSQLQRRFRLSTGFTLAEYWRMKKFQYAQQLLLNKELGIEEIAYRIGYENVSAFSRRFHQTYGLSPTQWRHMNLKAKYMRVLDN